MDPAIEKDPNPNMIVAMRVRPDNDKEKYCSKSRTVVRVLDERVVIFDPADTSTAHSKGVPDHFRRSRDQRYIFDRVFDQYSSQAEVYEHTAKHLIDGVMTGFNATVFAYGATGSGKTHTMIGNTSMPGVMPQALQDLFARIEERRDETIFTIFISYLEIYNEQIRDLLVEGATSLELRVSSNDTAVVAGLSQHKVDSADEIMDLLLCGNTRRAVSPTDANEVSSRSHAVLQVAVQQKDRTADVRAAVKMGKLALIDLAGSERACVSNNCGARLKEGANINKSLLALGNCINALGEGAKKGGKVHVPYRNSKLTRLLKDSLGGNCRTVMIATVSPSSLSYEDSLNTLKYANRAKNIRMQVKRNVVNINYHVAEYKQIVESLRAQVSALKTKVQQMEREKQELLANTQAKNSAAEEKEQSALEVIVAKIRANLEERARFKQNLRELEERGKNDTHLSQKKLKSIHDWETNPNRGTTGVFTPPQISKMREEVRTIQHNKNERSVIKKNVQKKLDLNIAAYQQFQLEIGKVITSAHRRQLLEQEEKIHLLHMEKKDVSGEKDLLQRETEHQAEKIAQLEALLKEQSLLLKGRGLMSEQLSRQYTSTTGEILFTPRRQSSPGSASMARYSPFTRNRTPMSLPRTRPIFDEESETTDMFLRASPRDSEDSSAGDDVQGVVRGLARVQLSQQQQKEPQSDDLDDLEPFAEPTKAQRPQPTHTAAGGSAAPFVAKSPFRSPARRRPRRLRSILKKPADDNGSAAKKMVSFSGVPDSSSPVAGPVRVPVRMPKSPAPDRGAAAVPFSPLSAPAERHLQPTFSLNTSVDEAPASEAPKTRRKRPTLPTPQVPPVVTAQSLLDRVGSSAATKVRRPRPVGEGLSRVMAPTQASLQRSNKRKSQQVDSITMSAPSEHRRLSKERKTDSASSTKENTANNSQLSASRLDISATAAALKKPKASALSKPPTRVPLVSSSEGVKSG